MSLSRMYKRHRFPPKIIGVGFPVALLFAWVYELTPAGLKLTKKLQLEYTIAASYLADMGKPQKIERLWFTLSPLAAYLRKLANDRSSSSTTAFCEVYLFNISFLRYNETLKMEVLNGYARIK